MASYKFKLIVEEWPDRKMEGWIWSDDLFDIRDALYEAVIRYEASTQDGKSKDDIDKMFYDMGPADLQIINSGGIPGVHDCEVDCIGKP